METVSTSTPWYRSVQFIILAAIVLPPVGLILLWTRRETETGKKVFGSLGIVALGAVYVFLLLGGGFFAKPDPRMEAHYDELERQRAQQKEKASASGAALTPAFARVISGHL